MSELPDIRYHGPVVSFDLDDTLFRERDFCRSGFRFLCDPARFRIAGISDYPSEEVMKLLVDKMDIELSNRRNPFIPFEEFFGSVKESGALQAYRTHIPDHIALAEGVRGTLDALSKEGIRMALITDGRSVTQRRKIRALDLEQYFSPELILISEETGHEKLESKEMFASVVRAYPEASKFIYVGNNPLKDFYFPNLLGWNTFQVPHHPDDVNPPMPAPSPLHAAETVLNQFSDLLSLVISEQY